ncbi:plasminogen activator inhibitor 1-like [Caloenas nicobarica]|uniref:plasminogen activator inhibitor 1-like n=1 Tax=Caloenas nicobarica TaxID=187106 RepID=UPI0032B7B47B
MVRGQGVGTWPGGATKKEDSPGLVVVAAVVVVVVVVMVIVIEVGIVVVVTGTVVVVVIVVGTVVVVVMVGLGVLVIVVGMVWGMVTVAGMVVVVVTVVVITETRCVKECPTLTSKVHETPLGMSQHLQDPVLSPPALAVACPHCGVRPGTEAGMRVVPAALVALAWVALVGARIPATGRVAQLVADFGLRLFREAVGHRGDTNVIFAPHGATTVLLALQLATGRHGRHQLEGAMGFSINDPGVVAELWVLRRALRGPGHLLAVAEGLFVGQGLTLTPGFVPLFTRTLGPRRLARVNFQRGEGARALLNAWVQERTQGRIRGLLPPGAVGASTRLVLASALYFRGAWRSPFPTLATRPRPFHRPDGTTVTVPMMEKTAKFNYGDFETLGGVPYEVVEVPCAGGEVAMLLVALTWRDVPIVTLTRLLDAQLVTTWVTNMTPVTRVLILPRFSLETSWDLKAPLKSLGVHAPFDPNAADFTPLSAEEPLVLGQVLQKVRMEVTENGTEVTSATAAIIYSRMAPLEILLDRPFLFLVRHNPTGTILFVGQVTEP